MKAEGRRPYRASPRRYERDAGRARAAPAFAIEIAVTYSSGLVNQLNTADLLVFDNA